MGLGQSKEAVSVPLASADGLAAGSQVRQSQRREQRTRPGKRSRTRSSETAEDAVLLTPKRMKTTSRYIYDNLFVQGRDSDVVVNALGRQWKLHKLYLSQSAYFSCMFSGSWKESECDVITMDVADPNVTVEALDTALGFLYQDEIAIPPTKVIPVLASATLLQLDDLIDQAVVLMKETVNVQTVLQYLEAARLYGAVSLENECLKWLRVNLFCHVPEHPSCLRSLSVELMMELIGSADLFVMQTEFSIYVLLRLWTFLLLKPTWHGASQEAVQESHRFFQERAKSDQVYFLDSPEGNRFVPAFRKLRLPYLICHNMDLDMLLMDRILPLPWLHPVFLSQWQTLLRVDQNVAQEDISATQKAFDENCLRCGRTLHVAGGLTHMWRWTGFHQGLDLIVTFDNYVISLKRNVGESNGALHQALLSTHKRRELMYRLNVVSLNEQKQVVFTQSTAIETVKLDRNESHVVLRLNPKATRFPLLLSFNFLFSSPPATDGGETQDVENVQA